MPTETAPSFRDAVSTHAVAVAASAGGVAALSVFVSHLPEDFFAPIVVAQHLAADKPSFLRNILQRSGPMPVEWAEPGQLVAPGSIYIAPPGVHIEITRDGAVRLFENEPGGRYRPSGNILFESLAQSFGPGAIGIVLSGSLNDGAAGARAIRNAGGRVFVQSPECCEHADMPIAALLTGAVDLALPVRFLAAAVTGLVMVPGASGVFTVGDSYRESLADAARWPVARGVR